MITKQKKQKLLRAMASNYKMDSEKLELWLQHVGDIYKEKTLEYEAIPTQKEHRDSCKAIANKSLGLIKQLDSAPHLKAYIDTHDQLPTITDLMQALTLLHEAMETVDLNRYKDDGTKSSSKLEFHRNHLILDLAATWQELTEKEHSYSPDFESFIELACEHMDINSKGLWRKYTELRNNNKI